MPQSGVLGGDSRSGQDGSQPKTTAVEQPSAAPGGSAAVVDQVTHKEREESMKTEEKEDEVKEKGPSAVSQTMEVDDGAVELSVEEERKRAKREKRMEEQLALRLATEKAAFERNEEDTKRREENRKEEEEERKKRKEKREAQARARAAGIPFPTSDSSTSDSPETSDSDTPATSTSNSSGTSPSHILRAGTSNNPGTSASNNPGTSASNNPGTSASNDPGTSVSNAPGAESGENKGDTPHYLARLLSELITGVADPAGPHRPTDLTEGGVASEDKEESGATVATDKPNEAVPKTANKSEGKEVAGSPGENNDEEEEAPRRSFAERYAGPDGTTVTISAAPTASCGLSMAGPSVSIKNPGAGAKPEVSGGHLKLRILLMGAMWRDD